VNVRMTPQTRKTRAQVSLARLLSKFGLASRSEACGIIAAGRVKVNGVVVRSAERWIDPHADRVMVDGRPLRPRQFVYIAMHKPAGVVTTRSDEHARPTVYRLLPDVGCRLFPVGRLDKETSGLLLFTNDTRFGERITSPDSGIAKTYVVHPDIPLAEGHRRIMEEGMELRRGERLLPAQVVCKDGGRICEITIREGRNRQVRRMFAAFGYVVSSLHRTRIGPVKLGALAPGMVRPLLPGEIKALSSCREVRP